jgi:ribosomal protein L24
MILNLRIVLFCSLVVISGCQTTANALNKKNPDKYVEVIQDDPSINIEDKLKSSNVNYICKELYFGKGSSQNRRACYIKAPEESRYKAWSVKMLDVPEAILEDTGNAVIVVGKVFLEGCMVSYCHN